MIDRIMLKTTEHGDTRIRWKMMSQLEDLDYADNIASVYSTWTQPQTRLQRWVEMLKIQD